MTVAKAPQFKSFEEYLATDSADLPEGRYEYWDGDLIEVMPESFFNDALANHLLILLVGAGIPLDLIRPGKVEVVVPGRPKTRFPDLTILEEAHLLLSPRRATITLDMPPPKLVVEVVSPGDENSANYKRDYQAKPKQYAERKVPEVWLIDPERNWVQVGSLVNGAYLFTTFQGNNLVISPIFPDLNLAAAQVLRT
jgi:Uma2 family endonuclease